MIYMSTYHVLAGGRRDRDGFGSVIIVGSTVLIKSRNPRGTGSHPLIQCSSLGDGYNKKCKINIKYKEKIKERNRRVEMCNQEK